MSGTLLVRTTILLANTTFPCLYKPTPSTSFCKTIHQTNEYGNPVPHTTRITGAGATNTHGMHGTGATKGAHGIGLSTGNHGHNKCCYIWSVSKLSNVVLSFLVHMMQLESHMRS